ncbi:hypothetical protein [Paractinoplanes globisporus]|uniref:Uncharacterized protein n=1 Tax=Paractinoplanes globisporus TaxID=113565 RepID=A0ABW6W858_9ACTN|nr:hypothetical protein [Actinoplanes globisporus]
MTTTDHVKIADSGSLSGRRLWRRWFFTVTLGEFLGFSAPAVVGAATAPAPAALAATAVVLAGAVEGAVLGWAQASVLRHALQGLHVAHWVAATAGGAVIAYAIGMLPSTAVGMGIDVPPSLLIALGPVLGLGLLLSIGTAQWCVLRLYVHHPARWIAVTASAWTAGLGVFLAFSMPLWHPGQGLVAIAAIGVAGGLLMAATTSAITGFGLCRLLARTLR